MESPILTIHHLTVGYRGVPLITEIDLTIHPGEIVTLLGPNGSGKSTILKTLLRQILPLAGEVEINGKPLFTQTDRSAASDIAAVLTNRVRTDYMMAYDVAAAGRYPHTGADGILQANDIAAIEDAMALMRAAELGKKPFDELSDGQKQRVLIARAIAQEPKLLLLDEPMTHLDIRYQAELLQALFGLVKERGIAVLMSLHEIEPARRISDQVFCIREDHSHFTGTPREVLTEENLQTLFDIGPEIADWVRL